MDACVSIVIKAVFRSDVHNGSVHWAVFLYRYTVGELTNKFSYCVYFFFFIFIFIFFFLVQGVAMYLYMGMIPKIALE